MKASTLPGQAARFVLVGAANTLMTGAIFLTLAYVVPVWFAYSVAFALGIVFTTAITPRIVFRARPSVVRRLTFMAWYLVVYLVGLACVALLSEGMHLDHLRVVAISLVVTTGLSFFGGRLLFWKRAGEPH